MQRKTNTAVKLYSEIPLAPLALSVSLSDKVALLGSCFSDEMSRKMDAAGFEILSNPFGTLYNPESILSAMRRLDSGEPFVAADCVQIGAGSTLWCSHSHHTSFAAATPEEFLEGANASLAVASERWRACTKVIVTLGTAMIWRKDGAAVTNCLKRPQSEFTHEMLSVGEVAASISEMLSAHPDKGFIFTVSPIRHLGEGAHLNTLSKATLHLGLEKALAEAPGACYFDSYEYLLDELRDYRFFADDLVHPSRSAVELIWERFIAAAVPASDLDTLRSNEKLSRHLAHRPVSK